MTPRLLMVGNERFAARPGGLDRYLDAFARAFAEAGGVVHVLSSSTPRRLPLVLRAAVLAARATRIDADIIDTHFAPTGLFVQWLARLRGKTLVAHFQGPWADETRMQDRTRAAGTAVRRWVERAAYRRPEAIIVLSKAFHDLLIAQYGVDPGRVHVIPPGVDLARFRFAPEPVAASPAAGSDGPIVLVVRRLTPRMGIETLIDAWPAVLSTHPRARLLIAGDGPSRAQLEAQVATLGPAANIELRGNISDDELVDAYRSATLSVVPSLAFEGFGLVVLESLACGTPCVVTRVGGLVEAIGDLDPALVVEPAAAGILSSRIIAALDGDLPARAACRAHAEQYAWPKIIERHLNLYAGLSGGAR